MLAFFVQQNLRTTSSYIDLSKKSKKKTEKKLLRLIKLETEMRKLKVKH